MFNLKINKNIGLLLSVFFFGVILRVYNIGSESLWFDEISSVDQASRRVFVLFHILCLYQGFAS